MRFKYILWDIDGTLLDFIAAEKVAIRACFEKFEMGECTDEMIARYSKINRKYWEALERGEITKQEVLVGRYREFFETEGLDVSKAEPFNDEYQIRLGDTCVFRDGGYEIVSKLKGRVVQYAVTNGTSRAQERKLINSGLDKLLDGVYISDKIGFEKPTSQFFVPVFEAISKLEKETNKEINNEINKGINKGINKDEVLIIGDSLTSDIRGGNNVGIKTCWYNPKGEDNNQGAHVDYEITNLNEIYDIIEITNLD